MALSEHLKFKLRKTYEASAFVSMKYRGNDLDFKTDAEGNPISLFIGRRTRNGSIKGERYTRMLKKNPDGTIVKDHWDYKGRSS
ncbi:MAG TPA: hypothetical protein VEB86_13620 [Chryseosolibacter sp.]|nr:hypothetical protein [Chryseosolibacter sp.]